LKLDALANEAYGLEAKIHEWRVNDWREGFTLETRKKTRLADTRGTHDHNLANEVERFGGIVKT